jgi:hypothetical protein
MGVERKRFGDLGLPAAASLRWLQLVDYRDERREDAVDGAILHVLGLAGLVEMHGTAEQYGGDHGVAGADRVYVMDERQQDWSPVPAKFIRGDGGGFKLAGDLLERGEHGYLGGSLARPSNYIRREEGV